ncbi:MAG: hypothetical protein NVS1B10_05080 [Candidatus Saccharimonadales bacterium]
MKIAPKKPKKPKLLKVTAKPFKGVARLASKGAGKLPGRSKTADERVESALSNVPRITNDTVADHREDVLSSARKYIYPLQHSKHSVVRTSLGLFVILLIAFFTICGLDLYKFQTTSGFIYDVTRIIPFPVAKTGNNYIGYESYLFELRRNMHYYQTQQQANFKTRDGQTQLLRLKQQAMNQVIKDSFVKQLAVTNHVSVTDKNVEDELSQVRQENRLGNNDRVFRQVLNEFWGWDEADFKRELKQQLLQQAVVAKLDSANNSRAQSALTQLKGGADFAALAAQVSDDSSTKTSGGQYPAAITLSDRELPPALTAALFKLKPGQISDIINSGNSLEIIKMIDQTGSTAHAAHIQFRYDSISKYSKPLEAKQAVHKYIKV